jgi:hypothetical protein
METTKDYWFSLKSHVYVDFKNGKILLYDTQTGNHIETASGYAISLVSQLYEPKNLGVTLLSKVIQTNPDIQNFVREVCSFYSVFSDSLYLFLM